MHTHGYNKKQLQLYNSKYTFLLEDVQIYMVLTYTFFKPYISKICNIYIYIYIYIIHLPQK